MYDDHLQKINIDVFKRKQFILSYVYYTGSIRQHHKLPNVKYVVNGHTYFDCQWRPHGDRLVTVVLGRHVDVSVKDGTPDL